jgi:hypothetical protein
MTNNTVKVEIKQVYGMERIYPACDIAKKLNLLMSSKTFSRRDIDVIKSLGYVIEVQPNSL